MMHRTVHFLIRLRNDLIPENYDVKCAYINRYNLIQVRGALSWLAPSVRAPRRCPLRSYMNAVSSEAAALR